MFLRNRVSGQVHDVPDHLIQGFHTAQEVDGFGDPLGLPFLAALVPMLSSIIPSLLPAVGGLLKGGGAPAPPAPAPTPIVASPPPPPPVHAEMPPPIPMYPLRRMARDPDMSRNGDDDVPPLRRGIGPMDPGAPPPGPGVIYRVKRKPRRRRRRAAPPQVQGYGMWY
jgi:hypothetical protein